MASSTENHHESSYSEDGNDTDKSFELSDNDKLDSEDEFAKRSTSKRPRKVFTSNLFYRLIFKLLTLLPKNHLFSH